MDGDCVIRKWPVASGKKTLRRILGPVCENDLWWTLRRNEEHYESLGGTDMVKYIKFKRLQWAGLMVRMEDT